MHTTLDPVSKQGANVLNTTEFIDLMQLIVWMSSHQTSAAAELIVSLELDPHPCRLRMFCHI
jgi:hypothetical protein